MRLTPFPKRQTNQGNTLLIIMGTVLVLGIAIASVLALVTQEHRIMARTTAWNAALPVAEAGVEEAMSHLWQVDGGYRAANGWVQSGSNFVKTVYLPEGRYAVGISSSDPPIIIAAGQVWCPSANRYIERRIQVHTWAPGVFVKGLLAKNSIAISGQFTTDSFDSSDPTYSNNGSYAPSKRKDNGDIASNLSSPGAISVSGQVKVYGNVSTGPAGTIDINDTTLAAVGTTNFIDSGGTGIQSGHYAQDMNVAIPDVEEPFTGGGISPLGINLRGIFYKYILDSGNYTLSSLNLSGKEKVLVRGNATLLVDNDVSISGQAYIQIAPGANLQLYVKKGTVSLTGNSIANKTGIASNFQLWGMPEVGSIKLSGNGEIIGTMYAPQANLSMTGSGTGLMDFMGAAIVNEVSGSGNYRFHYDEALGYNTAKNLIVTSWREF